ncbi:MAG: 50S ribosomal protein L28 [Proteobacteria bacterium]|nr:50S ribosomal protein L28 [Pseudomonadota bacterium]
MARVCELTGSKTQVGMNVSHSNRHTKRTFKPNLQSKTYRSEILGRTVSLTLATRAIRTIDKYNGLDGFMTHVKNKQVREKFSTAAARVRKAILKKVATAAPAAKPAAKAKKAPAKKKAASAE